MERSRVCSVHEETGQGVRLRNSLQWLSQRHVDHHVLPPSLPSYSHFLSTRHLSLPFLPSLCFVSVYGILSARLHALSPKSPTPSPNPTQTRLYVCLGHARSSGQALSHSLDVLDLTVSLHLFVSINKYKDCAPKERFSGGSKLEKVTH